ncbi:hypothetical protein C0992_005595, partial [Termitomyces sp. T32_za158]
LNAFNISSTQFCDTCKIHVQIGTGGEANWNQHLNSKVHKSKAGPPIKNTLTSFFTKSKVTGMLNTPSTILPPPPLKASLPSNSIHSTLENTIPLPSTPQQDLFATFTPSDDQKHAHAIILRIFRLAGELPQSVPLATKDDIWARFTADISSELPEYENDIFMLVNRTLHSTFGYQMTPKDLLILIRRGHLGVEAFCNWAMKCMIDFQLSGGILEPRLELLEQALKSL